MADVSTVCILNLSLVYIPHPVSTYFYSLQVEQIQAEYKVRALQFHPDKNPDDAEAEARFQELQVRSIILILIWSSCMIISEVPFTTFLTSIAQSYSNAYLENGS